MNTKLFAAARPALVLFVLLSVLTGIVYPLMVTGVVRSFFPEQAAGSLVLRAGLPVGSALIGQHFSDPRQFWAALRRPRPCHTTRRPPPVPTWAP